VNRALHAEMQRQASSTIKKQRAEERERRSMKLEMKQNPKNEKENSLKQCEDEENVEKKNFISSEVHALRPLLARVFCCPIHDHQADDDPIFAQQVLTHPGNVCSFHSFLSSAIIEKVDDEPEANSALRTMITERAHKVQLTLDK
jgi:hypothetical protein